MDAKTRRAAALEIARAEPIECLKQGIIDTLGVTEAVSERADEIAAILERHDTDTDEARSHLGAALIQTVPSDDQIIMDHVRDAYRLLGGK